MGHTRCVSEREGESELERNGERRAAAAHDRLEHARERAGRAREEADTASSAEAAEARREEADFHDRAADLQVAAEEMQRRHAAEHHEDQVDEGDEDDGRP
jgi:hypothetical protein